MKPATTHRAPLFWASFATLIAAGMGFAIRAGILRDWGEQFGFTQTDLGTITGGGLIGFGFTIIGCSLFADKVGYKPLMIAAFTLHVLSAIVTLSATPVFLAAGRTPTYWTLWTGMLMFALANGICEAVINPLTATLYPRQKTHYLNILHAGWPGGLILGGLIAFCFCGANAFIYRLPWEATMALFLIPTLIYGIVMLKEAFPHSEAKAAGVSLGRMLLEFTAPLLLVLFLLHALVGYVELGTDSWITNITQNLMGQGAFLLFIYTSALMFVLRFFAGPIVERINPVGLLLISAILGCIGLFWLGSTSIVWLMVAAATVYGVGKTFLWPTMLGVVGERYPRGGALTMGTIGGIGMLSAGFLGGPGIGYKQDYYASNRLEETAPKTYARYKADEKSSFLFFPAIYGLDGAKVGVLDFGKKGLTEGDGADIKLQLELLKEEGKTLEQADKEFQAKVAWWENAKQYLAKDKPLVLRARTYGGQMALRWTALVPAIMAVGYLGIFIYFLLTGGYKPESLEAKGLRAEDLDAEELAGGVEGPVR